MERSPPRPWLSGANAARGRASTPGQVSRARSSLEGAGARGRFRRRPSLLRAQPTEHCPRVVERRPRLGGVRPSPTPRASSHAPTQSPRTHTAALPPTHHRPHPLHHPSLHTPSSPAFRNPPTHILRTSEGMRGPGLGGSSPFVVAARPPSSFLRQPRCVRGSTQLGLTTCCEVAEGRSGQPALARGVAPPRVRAVLRRWRGEGPRRHRPHLRV